MQEELITVDEHEDIMLANSKTDAASKLLARYNAAQNMSTHHLEKLLAMMTICEILDLLDREQEENAGHVWFEIYS